MPSVHQTQNRGPLRFPVGAKLVFTAPDGRQSTLVVKRDVYERDRVVVGRRGVFPASAVEEFYGQPLNRTAQKEAE